MVASSSSSSSSRSSSSSSSSSSRVVVAPQLRQRGVLVFGVPGFASILEA